MAAGARHRPADSGAGTRRQDHFQRDHLRNRYPRFCHAGKDAVAAVGESVVTPEERRTLGPDHHPETEDRRFQAADPLAINSCPDPARGEDFCGVARNAGEGNRRYRLPPDGRRRQRIAPGLAGRRHRHARPPLGPCRARDRRLAQEIRQCRRDPGQCLRWAGKGGVGTRPRPCEEPLRRSNPCFVPAPLWIASRSLSSGAFARAVGSQ